MSNNRKTITIKCTGTRYLKHTELKTFQGNLKSFAKASKEKLKKNIINNGWIAPVFLWNGNEILDGHGRIEALKELVEEGYSIDDIPVVDIKAQNKCEAAKMLLSINSQYQKITNEGMFEFSLANNIGLSDIENIIIPEVRLDDIFNFNLTVPQNDVKEVTEPQTQLGDLYILGEHRLLCGDCTESNSYNRLFEGKKVDMLLTDPPYGVDYSAKNKMLNKFDRGNRIQKAINNDSISDYRKFFSSFLSVIEFNNYNTIYIFMSGQELHSLRLAISDCGMTWCDYLIWVKNHIVLGRKDYNSKHEFILYGWKGKHRFYGSNSSTVLEYDKPQQSKLHPTMKPIPLLKKLLKDGSKKGDLVYDPFMGSGSTLLSCTDMNRICYGFELDPCYCDTIVNRYVEQTGNDMIIKNGEEIKWQV